MSAFCLLAVAKLLWRSGFGSLTANAVHAVNAGAKQILGNISVESTIITRRVSEGFTPPSLADASGYENVALSDAE